MKALNISKDLKSACCLLLGLVCVLIIVPILLLINIFILGFGLIGAVIGSLTPDSSRSGIEDRGDTGWDRSPRFFK